MKVEPRSITRLKPAASGAGAEQFWKPNGTGGQDRRRYQGLMRKPYSRSIFPETE
jgi:hypothetical protein